jgi:hypothetical protein
MHKTHISLVEKLYLLTCQSFGKRIGEMEENGKDIFQTS